MQTLQSNSQSIAAPRLVLTAEPSDEANQVLAKALIRLGGSLQ